MVKDPERRDIILRVTKRKRERLIEVLGKEGERRVPAMILKWMDEKLELKEKQYGLNKCQEEKSNT